MFLRPLIFDHGWLKLFSLLLASLIWFAIHTSVGVGPGASRRMTREFLHRPVLLLADATAREAALVEPAFVNVFVQGPANLLTELKDHDVQVFVYLNDGRPFGAASVRVHVPAGVTVSHIDPRTVMVRPAASP